MSGDISPTSRFEVTARLHVGGMAEVFLAVQKAGSVQRRVVVKRMLPDLASHEEMRARFFEEARHLARLAGPGLPAFIDAGEDADGPYLIQQYVDGVNLRELSAATGTLAERHAAAVVSQALLILARLHAARGEDGVRLGFVHRDLAPENLQLARDGTLWLLDLGLAKSRESAVRTASGVRQGRLSYMAPEQVRGEAVGSAADVYALAVVAAELVGALDPLGALQEAAPSTALVERLSNQGVWGRLDWPVQTSEQFRAAVERALSPQPEGRPDAEALHGQLAPLGAGAGLEDLCEAAMEARPPRNVGRPTPRLAEPPFAPHRRKPPLVPALVLGTIAAVVFVWVGATRLAAPPARERALRAEGPAPTDGARVVIVPPAGGPYEIVVDGRPGRPLSEQRVLALSPGAHTVVLTDAAANRYYREDFFVGKGEERLLRFPFDTANKNDFGGK